MVCRLGVPILRVNMVKTKHLCSKTLALLLFVLCGALWLLAVGSFCHVLSCLMSDCCV